MSNFACLWPRSGYHRVIREGRMSCVTRTKTDKVIEIWANEEGTEYAIRTSKDEKFRYATKSGIVYNHVVEGLPCVLDLPESIYDWKLILRHWIREKREQAYLQKFVYGT